MERAILGPTLDTVEMDVPRQFVDRVNDGQYGIQDIIRMMQIRHYPLKVVIHLMHPGQSPYQEVSYTSSGDLSEHIEIEITQTASSLKYTALKDVPIERPGNTNPHLMNASTANQFTNSTIFSIEHKHSINNGRNYVSGGNYVDVRRFALRIARSPFGEFFVKDWLSRNKTRYSDWLPRNA